MNTVITSLTRDIYDRYGKLFIDSFNALWPKDVGLTVYWEGEDPPDMGRANIVPASEVRGLDEWLDAISRVPLLNGDMGDKYNIQFDARMARKAFMQGHACETIGGKIFWIDADVVTFNKIPKNFLDEVLPDDQFSCFLGRDWFYTESGFLGFNSDHPIAKQFLGPYRGIFQTGAIFTMRSWHDCISYDMVREQFHKKHFNDLAVGLPKTMHPFVNCILGKYMDHRKGKRKASRTPLEDLVVPRKELYWQ